MSKAGRPPKIGAAYYAFIVDLASRHPRSNQRQLLERFQKETGITCHPATFARVLKMAGVMTRGTVSRRRCAVPLASATHDRDESPRTDGLGEAWGLTDAEWALVADLFEHDGGPGKPPRHSRRQLLDACCHVVRTGCAWRALPGGFPHWDNVYKTFHRWSEQGKFEQMQDRLRDMWRHRAKGRDSAVSEKTARCAEDP